MDRRRPDRQPGRALGCATGLVDLLPLGHHHRRRVWLGLSHPSLAMGRDTHPYATADHGLQWIGSGVAAHGACYAVGPCTARHRACNLCKLASQALTRLPVGMLGEGRRCGPRTAFDLRLAAPISRPGNDPVGNHRIGSLKPKQGGVNPALPQTPNLSKTLTTTLIIYQNQALAAPLHSGGHAPHGINCPPLTSITCPTT